MLQALDDDKAHDPSKGDGVAGGVLDELGVRKREPHIRCPKCRWQPRKEDRWMCKCGCVWNTFDTRGQCPRCGFVWAQTQCLACQGWSLHEEWYSPGDEDAPT